MVVNRFKTQRNTGAESIGQKPSITKRLRL